jgi:hypothetical protein
VIAGGLVVVRLVPDVSDRTAALADALVVEAGGRSAGGWCRELFGRFPELTIAAVRYGGGQLVLGLRDGRLVGARGGAGVAVRLLYRRDAAGAGRSSRFWRGGRWRGRAVEFRQPPP